MAKKEPLPHGGDQQQRQAQRDKAHANQANAERKQPHEIAQQANMKRQQKKMHEQDNK